MRAQRRRVAHEMMQPHAGCERLASGQRLHSSGDNGARSDSDEDALISNLRTLSQSR